MGNKLTGLLQRVDFHNRPRPRAGRPQFRTGEPKIRCYSPRLYSVFRH